MKRRWPLFVMLLTAAFLMPISGGGAGAQKLVFKTCPQPLPLQLKPFTNQPQRIDFLCGNTGCPRNAANDLQNAQKNDKHPFVREAAADALKAIDRASRKIDS